MGTTTKICNVCKEEKPLDQFYFRKDSGNYKNRCKRCCIDEKNLVRSDTHKVCKHCGEEKPFSEFQKAGGGKWLQPYCKPCDSERKKKHHAENKDRILRRRNAYYQNNKEAILLKEKEKRDAEKLANPPKPRVFKRMSKEEYKRRKSICDKRYRQNNPEKIRANKNGYKQSGRATETAKAWQAKQMGSIEFRTKKRLRGRIYVALKRGIKSQSTMALLGCSIDFFKQHFAALFTEGMNWDKYMKGKIVIDHIKPCKLFDLTNPEEQKKCFHYKNLQPLWELDNLKKGAKYERTELQGQV